MSAVRAPPFRIALVLAGGAARGAYEVGVVSYLLEDVARALGRPVAIDFLCGTSVGAINACFLAGASDDPGRAARLERLWTRVRIAHVVRLDTALMWQTVRGLFGRPSPPVRRGGLLDPTGLARLVATSIAFGRIDEHLRAGRLRALTVATTHIASGRSVVYLDRLEDGLPYWGSDPTLEGRRVRITAAHALASAAIPFLFPAVELDGDYHCDGGLRLNVPLSPARRLGASGMVVVSPKQEAGEAVPEELAVERQADFPSPLFLLGKTLNAFTLDRLDADIERLDRITSMLDAGTRLYGPDFVSRLNRELGRKLRPIHTVLVRASESIAEMATTFVRSPAFESRASGVVGALLRRLAEARESDLLSYLLFDGEFARQLIELGRADARARHEELCALFARAAPA